MCQEMNESIKSEQKCEKMKRNKRVNEMWRVRHTDEAKTYTNNVLFLMVLKLLLKYIDLWLNLHQEYICTFIEWIQYYVWCENEYKQNEITLSLPLLLTVFSMSWL